MIRKRWESKFARFVEVYGVRRLAEELHINSSAIYHWIRGATNPSIDHARAMIRMARKVGIKLTFEDILLDRTGISPQEQKKS